MLELRADAVAARGSDAVDGLRMRDNEIRIINSERGKGNKVVFYLLQIYIDSYLWLELDFPAQWYQHAVRYQVDSSHIHGSGGIPSHIYSKARNQTRFPRGRSS